MRKILTAVVLTACATKPPPEPKGGPRGLRASEHLEEAHRHDEAARQSSVGPEVTAFVPGSTDQPVVTPWFRSWDTAAEHERMAAIHRSKAAELDAEYQEACGDRPLAEVSMSPLVRYAVGSWNTATGAIVYLSKDAGPPEKFLADMRCHRAWMMIAPTAMDDCPLDLPGLLIDARGDAQGITLSLGVHDEKLVPELQRRVAHDLEAHNVH